MNDDLKHWTATMVALFFSWLSWVATHIAAISGGFAILAAVYSIAASRASKRLSDDKRENPHKYQNDNL